MIDAYDSEEKTNEAIFAEDEVTRSFVKSPTLTHTAIGMR